MTYEEKMKIGQDSYDAFNRKDLDALLRLYDAECEWDMSNFHGWPEKSLYRGHEGLTEFFHAWFEPWEDFQIEIGEGVDLPGDRVYGIGHGRGRGRSSGVAVELPPLAQISEFRGGKLFRIVNYSDIEEARKAAGLPQQGAHSEAS